jgi:hypothetical protein
MGGNGIRPAVAAAVMVFVVVVNAWQRWYRVDVGWMWRQLPTATNHHRMGVSGQDDSMSRLGTGNRRCEAKLAPREE